MWTFRYSLLPTATYGSMAWTTSLERYEDQDSAAINAGDLMALCALHSLPLIVQLIPAPTPEPAE